jgi:hypothetical protein
MIDMKFVKTANFVIGLTIEWAFRLLVFFLALAGLIFSVLATASGEIVALLGVPVSLYFASIMIWPGCSKWIGCQLDRFNGLVETCFAEPVERLAAAIFKIAAPIIKLGFWAMLAIIAGIGAIIGVVFIAKGVAALPVSAAIIIGAIIIASALGQRGS